MQYVRFRHRTTSAAAIATRVAHTHIAMTLFLLFDASNFPVSARFLPIAFAIKSPPGLSSGHGYVKFACAIPPSVSTVTEYELSLSDVFEAPKSPTMSFPS